MNWQQLVDEAPRYGFLGGIVGIVGLMIGATLAILQFLGKFDDWRPQRESAMAGLNQLITAACGIGLIVGWALATPQNVVVYLRVAVALIVGGILAFILYVPLKTVLGRCRRPLVGKNNLPNGRSEIIWGGFWLTDEAKEAGAVGVLIPQTSGPPVHRRQTPCEFLAGNGYNADKVWPPLARALASFVITPTLLILIMAMTLGISTAATAAQVLLTKKPAIEIFSSSEVPGLPPPGGQRNENSTSVPAQPKQK